MLISFPDLPSDAETVTILFGSSAGSSQLGLRTDQMKVDLRDTLTPLTVPTPDIWKVSETMTGLGEILGKRVNPGY